MTQPTGNEVNKSKRPRGRPSAYSHDLTETICMELMTGRSLREICEADDLPSKRTVYRWLEKYPEFAQQYVLAREIQAHTLNDEVLELGFSRRAEVHAVIWHAGRMRPKKYVKGYHAPAAEQPKDLEALAREVRAILSSALDPPDSGPGTES